MKMTHEQMMEKAWRTMRELGITDDRKEFEKNPEGYLVKNIYTVRDAFYSDMEAGVELDEDAETFFARHGITAES